MPRSPVCPVRSGQGSSVSRAHAAVLRFRFVSSTVRCTEVNDIRHSQFGRLTLTGEQFARYEPVPSRLVAVWERAVECVRTAVRLTNDYESNRFVITAFRFCPLHRSFLGVYPIGMTGQRRDNAGRTRLWCL